MDYSFLSETDQQVIALSGYGSRRGFGERPALLIVDAQNKFIGPDAPILEAVKVYPLGIGERAHRALERMRALLDAARAAELPVFYSVNIVPLHETVFNSFARKRTVHERNMTIPAEGDDIHPSIAPKDGEWVIHKRCASALFGTPLASFLNALRCDTLIVAGFTTCGCVRAVSVEAASLNYNVMVAEDCVANRLEMSHKMALVDLGMKYADVLASDEIIAHLKAGDDKRRDAMS